MISTVSRAIGETRHEFRLTARAMMAIERSTGQGLFELFTDLEDVRRQKITTIITLLAEVMNDGAGATIEEAGVLVDQIGALPAGDLLGEVVEKAFPEAAKSGKGEARAGNRKRAAA